MERICTWCGGVFGSERAANAITCSDTCSSERHKERQRAYQARKYAAEREARPTLADINCQHCGEAFTPYRSWSKFCKRQCQWNSKSVAKRPRIRPCSKCGVDTPTKPGTAVCGACKLEKGRNKATAQAKERRRTLRSYGITQDQYDFMLGEQGGGCAICGRTDPGRRLQAHFSIDHCHITGLVRGLLCHPCNLGIGYLQDSPDIMRAAAAYVAPVRVELEDLTSEEIDNVAKLLAWGREVLEKKSA